jgi:hypothetical protein
MSPYQHGACQRYKDEGTDVNLKKKKHTYKIKLDLEKGLEINTVQDEIVSGGA